MKQNKNNEKKKKKKEQKKACTTLLNWNANNSELEKKKPTTLRIFSVSAAQTLYNVSAAAIKIN